MREREEGVSKVESRINKRKGQKIEEKKNLNEYIMVPALLLRKEEERRKRARGREVVRENSYES